MAPKKLVVIEKESLAIGAKNVPLDVVDVKQPLPDADAPKGVALETGPRRL